MVMPDDTLKLIDFGIARLFSPGKHADTAQFGTPGYAPPEQYGGQTEPRSDIYSLGVVVHQMLTGYNPTGAAFMVPPASAIDPRSSRQWRTCCARLRLPNRQIVFLRSLIFAWPYGWHSRRRRQSQHRGSRH